MSHSQDHRVFLGQLAAPGVNLTRVAGRVKRKPELLEAVIAGVGSKTARVRLGATKILRILSQQAPELVYPHFDFFARLLEHENSILRWNAMIALASMAAADRDGKLDRMIDTYLAPIPGPRMIDAAQAIRGAAQIAVVKPYLAGTVASGILQVERACYATPECRNVAIGHAILALDQIFPAIDDRRPIHLFISRQVTNPRPATRSKAERFLKKWPVGRLRAAGAPTAS